MSRMNMTKSIESQECECLEYTEVVRTIQLVHKSLGLVGKSWSTDNEMNHSMRQVTGILERRGVCVVTFLTRNVSKLYTAALLF